MRIDVSETEQCGCVTCVQHRTSGTFNTQETEPSNVTFSSVTLNPVSSGPVQVLGDESSALGSTSTSSPVHSSSPITSGTETPLAPPVTTSVNSEPAKSIDSTIFNWGVFKSKNAPADASATSTSSLSSPVQSSSPTIFSFRPAVTPVSSERTQALGPTTSGSLPVPVFGSPPPFAASGPSIFCSSQAPVTSLFGSSASVASTSSTSSPFDAPSPLRWGSSQAPVTGFFGSGASPASTSSASSPFYAPSPFIWGSLQAPVTGFFGSGPSAASTSSTSSPFDAPSLLRWGSMPPPVQISAPNTSTPFSFLPAQDSGKTASAFPSLLSDRGDLARPNAGISPAISTPTPTRSFGETHFSSPFGPKQDFTMIGISVPMITENYPSGSLLPGFGYDYFPEYPSNLFGPNPPTTTPVSGRGSFFAAVETEQGSRYPRYAPTPDLDDLGCQGKMMISISASNSHRHKSHEELRWEDYKKGDKGGFGLFPAAHISPISSSTVSPSLFASPSIPDHPHEHAGVSSPASGCTACGATSSFSPTAHGTTTTTPAIEAYTMVFGTPNLAAQGTTTISALQPYPMMFGTPNIAAQCTTTDPAVQAYPMMFGTPNIAAQCTTPAVQAYPVHGLILLPFAAMSLQ